LFRHAYMATYAILPIRGGMTKNHPKQKQHTETKSETESE
jgi:hypothetical protein